MDLGISGRKAMVCGSTDGLGFACAVALAEAGVNVLINGRTSARVDAAVIRLREATGRESIGVAADVTSAPGRDLLFAVMPAPDIIVTNAAGPPAGSFEDWGVEDWTGALGANMITPIMVIRQAIGGMRERRWGRVINITSAAVKAPMPLLGLSNGARSGLTGFVSGLARDVAADGVTINNLLPGYFRTARLERYAEALALSRGISTADVWTELAEKNPSRRIGDPAEFGATCAFLASQHGAFITAQNLLLDGGAYPGTL